MRYGKIITLALVTAAFAGGAIAQHAPGPMKLVVHPLKGGAYYVSGGVSNTGFIVGDKGVIVIDAQVSADAAKMEQAEIAKITPKPVNTIILTHGDPDHVGWLLGFPQGIPIIAHENIRAQMKASAADPNGGPVYGSLYPALTAHYLPTQTLDKTETMTIDGVRMQLFHVAPAHSSGDLFIYLPAQKIVYGGDIVLTNTGRFPVIHIGGSSAGWIASVKVMLALDADTYVAGHGDLQTKAQLKARLEDVEQRRAQIKAMVNQNKSLAEVEAALPDPVVNPMFKTFTQTTYEELEKGYPPAEAPWANIVHR